MWGFPVASRCIFILIKTLLNHRNTATRKKFDFKNSHLTSVEARPNPPDAQQQHTPPQETCRIPGAFGVPGRHPKSGHLPGAPHLPGTCGGCLPGTSLHAAPAWYFFLWHPAVAPPWQAPTRYLFPRRPPGAIQIRRLLGASDTAPVFDFWVPWHF
jgi:hypothetical protein